jgi:hypothetical protein
MTDKANHLRCDKHPLCCRDGHVYTPHVGRAPCPIPGEHNGAQVRPQADPGNQTSLAA